jgi:hypothetical protein
MPTENARTHLLVCVCECVCVREREREGFERVHLRGFPARGFGKGFRARQIRA